VTAFSPYLVRSDIVLSGDAWPWMVAIYYAGEFQGAGVHLGEGWIVSAAHIIRPLTATDSGSRYVQL